MKPTDMRVGGVRFGFIFSARRSVVWGVGIDSLTHVGQMTGTWVGISPFCGASMALSCLGWGGAAHALKEASPYSAWEALGTNKAPASMRQSHTPPSPRRRSVHTAQATSTCLGASTPTYASPGKATPPSRRSVLFADQCTPPQPLCNIRYIAARGCTSPARRQEEEGLRFG